LTQIRTLSHGALRPTATVVSAGVVGSLPPEVVARRTERTQVLENEPEAVAWHGVEGALSGLRNPPELVAKHAQAARSGGEVDGSEFRDSADVLDNKVELLVSLLQGKSRVVVYSGAGLSTAAGMKDYASRAAGSLAFQEAGFQGKSVDHAQGQPHSVDDFVRLTPTYAHQALAALRQEGFAHDQCTQNHDRLAQKSGWPQSRLLEIHGAWGDNTNPCLAGADELRADLREWLEELSQSADLCLAVGTSAHGMTSDQLAISTAERYLDGTAGSGLVIVSLQRTRLDRFASLRIFGLLDEVFRLLTEKLSIAVPNEDCDRAGQAWCMSFPENKYDTPIREKT
jgi:NAD-dependent SIR2 family protein deacetylase